MKNRELKNFINKYKEKDCRRKPGHTSVVKIGIVVSIGISAVAAIVLASKKLLNSESGRETYENMKDKAEKKVDDIKETVHETKETAKKFANQVSEDIEHAIKVDQKKAKHIKKDIKDDFQEVTKELS